MEEIRYILSSKEPLLFLVKLLTAFSLSMLLSYLSIPMILKISKKKNLMDIPVERSSHNRQIPNLGGIAIFYSIGICAPIFAYELFESYKFLFPALVILLYVGVMDDIVAIKAQKKMIAQVIIAILMVVGSDIRIKSLFGLFGIYEINYWVSVFLSIFSFIIMINAFNLIDGIDGLAGAFSVICCFVYGVSYYHLGEYNYPMVVLCAIVMGALLSFLYYNLSDYKHRKIFMGDTGSMSIGFLLVFTTFYFINIFTVRNETGVFYYHLKTAPVIAFAIILLPVIDTLNVIIIRLLSKKSPLEADRNHIHHQLLDLGLSHKKATMYIISYYLVVLLVAYLSRHLDINLFFIEILILGILGAYLPSIILKYRKRV